MSDTGTGMDERKKARIFEPFFTTKGVGQGTGLGLSVVHGVVRQSDGHIAVYSEKDRGTTFKIYLPPVGKEWHSGMAHPALTAGAKGSETVLLVEDEDAVRKFARLALEMSGYTVLEARHGAEAILLAERYDGPIHLLVSDVIMPKMGGGVLAEKLLEARPGIKVLFVSGYTDDAVVRHGILHEDVAFLQKPFTPQSLTRRVREVLG
jgi:CheY-like chemotaxis protein